MADNDLDWGRPTRTFLYGKDKSKKTLWSCKAAEAGFNVVLIDGDDGASIIRAIDQTTKKPLISDEAKKRILVVDAVNLPDRPVFARFIATFMKMKDGGFIWDEQGKNSYAMTKLDPAHSYIKFDVSKLGMNDVVILDSWTKLATSTLLEWSIENKVDLTEVEKEGDQFSLLNYQSRFLDYCLTKINTLPCHVIVIGHETVYEKFEPDKVNPKKRVMVEQITQPFSSTGPHAKKIGSYFSNVMRFSRLSNEAFRIDTGGDKVTTGGCRQLAPNSYNWNDITPATIFAAVGSKATGEECHGAIWIPKGGSLPDLAKSHTTYMQVKELAAIPAGTEIPTQQQVLNVGGSVKKLSLSEKLKLNKGT